MTPKSPPRSRGGRALWSAVAAFTAITLPTFMVGTLAVQMRADLHFSPTELGLVVGASYAASTLFAIPSGSLAEQFSGVRMLRYSALAATVAMALIATVIQSWPELAAALFLAGAAGASGQTSSNLVLARRIDPDRQGLAFGIKQSAVPLAFLLGGLAVPGIALTVGWRWAFAAAALVALAAALWVPRPRITIAAQRATVRARPEPAGPLVALAIGFGLTLTACSSLGAFLVLSAVSTGLSGAAAGLVAVLASVCGISVRVGVGLLADRRGGRHLLLVVGMVLVGALGFGALAGGAWLRLPPLFIVGAVVAFGIGWGWNGLFNFAIVRSHPNHPARATGITQTGGRLGSVIGPLVFGVMVEQVGYPGAWGLASGEAVLGAATLLVARSLLQARIRGEAGLSSRPPR